MTFPKRFTLSTLLLVMLLVSLVFGYAQWRKQRLVALAKELKASGGQSFKLTDSWFWPNVSGGAVVRFDQYSDGTFVVANKALNPSEAEVYYDSICARLHAMGVKEVSCIVRPVRSNEVIVETIVNEPGK